MSENPFPQIVVLLANGTEIEVYESWQVEGGALKIGDRIILSPSAWLAIDVWPFLRPEA